MFKLIGSVSLFFGITGLVSKVLTMDLLTSNTALLIVSPQIVFIILGIVFLATKTKYSDTRIK